MDDFNRPLYGDVFGVLQGAEIAVGLPFPNRLQGNIADPPQHQNEINRELWGEIEPADDGELTLFHPKPRFQLTSPESEEEEEEEEEEPEPEPEPVPAPRANARVPTGGTETPSGLATPSGYNSVTSTVPGGLETPDFVDLRKKRDGTESEPSGPRELYQVIPEREATAKGFMGSSTAYDMSNLGKAGGRSGAAILGAEDRGNKVRYSFLSGVVLDKKLTSQRKVGDVDISVEGDDDLTQDQLKAKYEASRASAKQIHVPGADVDRSGFEDVRNEEMKKRQRNEDDKGGKGKGKDKGKGEKFKF